MGTKSIERDALTDRTVSLAALRALVAALSGSARAIESRTGLTNAQLFLLRQIATKDAMSINELAERAHTRQNTVSAVVGGLEAVGMVRKSQSPFDRRKAAVTITPKGKRVLARAPRSPTEILITGLAALQQADARALAAGLAALVGTLELRTDDAPLLFEKQSRRPRERAGRGRRTIEPSNQGRGP